MLLESRPRKTVFVPASGTVDISGFTPITTHPLFRLNEDRKQLGEAYKTFPGATHSRAAHMLSTKKLTGRRAQRLVEYGQITPQQAIDLEVVGLLHDWMHGPLSHVIDPLTAENHDQRGFRMLGEIEEAILQCGADPSRVRAMMDRESQTKDPLSELIFATPLGTDKLSYLELDAIMTGMEGMPNEGRFLDSCYFLDNKLVADFNIREQVKFLLQFYSQMFAEVYYRRSVLTTERFDQSMIAMLLGMNGQEPEITEQQLVAMTDSDLHYTMRYARNPTVKALFERYRAGGRPRAAITFHPEPYHAQRWWGQRTITSLSAPDSLFLNKELAKPATLYRLERQIEAVVDLPDGSVLIAPPVSPRRFKAPIIHFYTGNGIEELATVFPGLREQLDEQARSHAALYVCVFPEYRAKLADPANAKIVTDLLTPYH